MNETELTETLDRRGDLDVARGPGVYALELAVPDELGDAWDAAFDSRTDEAFVERAAAAERVLYVGASQDVYARLCDHFGGDARKARVMRVCPPVDVVDVTPSETPFERETLFAAAHADGSTLVWCNGDVW